MATENLQQRRPETTYKYTYPQMSFMNYRWNKVENGWQSRSFAFSLNYVRSIHAMAILLSQWPTPQGIRAVVIVTSTSSDQSQPRSFQFRKSVMRYSIKIIGRKCNWQNGGNFEMIEYLVWVEAAFRSRNHL